MSVKLLNNSDNVVSNLQDFNDNTSLNWTKYASTLSSLTDTAYYKLAITTASATATSGPNQDAYYLTDVYIGDDSSVICFNSGTKILCIRDNVEQYIPIELINKETDLVKTYKNGNRKVSKLKHMILNNNPEDFTQCMFVMPKKGDMIDDLIVTGGHSILVDKYETDEIENIHKELFGGQLEKIDSKVLVLAGKSDEFKKIENKEIFDIFHIALEGDSDEDDNRYSIWANGVLTESTYKKVLYKTLN